MKLSFSNNGWDASFKSIIDLAAAYGIDGIEYKDGVVDFSPISACSVDIDMTSCRYGPGGNFEKADTQAFHFQYVLFHRAIPH